MSHLHMHRTDECDIQSQELRLNSRAANALPHDWIPTNDYSSPYPSMQSDVRFKCFQFATTSIATTAISLECQMNWMVFNKSRSKWKLWKWETWYPSCIAKWWLFKSCSCRESELISGRQTELKRSRAHLQPLLIANVQKRVSPPEPSLQRM